jgi:AraC-like DNA-binding protein/mannose-6-phosphate isomerase-like protein (cupin superfamily)
MGENVSSVAGRRLRRIEGRERPRGLPASIRKIDGRWFGNAHVDFEGVRIRFIYFGINEQVGRGSFTGHRHPFSELCYTVSGHGRMIFEKHSVSCRPGHVFIAQPGLAHSAAWWLPRHKTWRAIIVQFDINVDQRAAPVEHDLQLPRIFGPVYDYFFAQRQSSFQLPAPAVAILERSTRHLMDMLRRHPEGGSAYMFGFWVELMAVLSQAIQGEGKGSERGTILPYTDLQKKLLRAKAMLEQDGASTLGIPELARAAGISLHHFIREFHRHFGLSPGQYRTGILMERAGKLFIQTDTPVSEAAESLGYASPASFAKAFRRHFGVTPREYRARYRSP